MKLNFLCRNPSVYRSFSRVFPELLASVAAVATSDPPDLQLPWIRSRPLRDMAESIETVRLVRSGHDPVDILPSQVTPLSVAWMFSVSGCTQVVIGVKAEQNQLYIFIYIHQSFYTQLDPSTVWLREQYGSRAFLPDTMNVKFDLPPDVAQVSLSLIMEGSDPAVLGTSSGSSSVHVTTPVVPRTAPLTVVGTNKTQTLNVKVIQATMECLRGGKCEFAHLGQTFVDVTESTANVNYIRSVVQKRWGFEYVPVTADGLEIEDSFGTQGIPLLCLEILTCMHVAYIIM